MGPEDFWQDSTSVNVSSERYRKVLTEYYQLARLPELEEPQAQRVYEILEQAEEDNVLSFFLNEIDELTYQELDLTNDEIRKHLSNEAAKVQERLPDVFSPQVLKPLVTASKYKFSTPVSPSYYSIPRVEMALDPGHIDRLNLEKAFFSDDQPVCPNCGETHFRQNTSGSYKCLLCGSKMPLGSFLKEESISILTSLSLLLILLFAFF